jgi:hypothetical protein
MATVTEQKHPQPEAPTGGGGSRGPARRRHGGEPRTATRAAIVLNETLRKQVQLDELQAQRLDPGDEAVERGSVGQPGDHHGLGYRLARVHRVERVEQARRQPPLDAEAVLVAHGVLHPGGCADLPDGACEDIVGAAG